MAQIAYVDWDGLVYYHKKITQYVNDSLEGCLKDGGYKKYANIPAPSFDTLNYIYVVTDSFVADEYFNAVYRNKQYAEGTVIKVTATASGIYEFTIFNESSSGGNDYPDIPDDPTPEDPDTPGGEDPEDPDNPGGDTPPDVEPDNSIAGTIINNSTPMYSINNDGELAVVEFKLLEYTVEEGKNAPTESGFYQIKDGNQVIEQGYQDKTAVYLTAPYIIALPVDVIIGENCDVKFFDDLQMSWNTFNLEFTNNAEEIEAVCNELNIALPQLDTEKYRLWATLDGAATGQILRFIIKE